VIELRETAFGFPKGPDLFQSLSISFASGQTTAILGPSGSGKSTIVRLVCGLLQPTAGEILLDGTTRAQAGLVRGALFQDDTLVPWLSTIENAVFPMRVASVPALSDRAMARLSEVGLKAAISKLPHELSSGMKKRLEFVRATVNDDRYLIADEPFSGLDFHQKRALWQLWRDHMQGSERTAVLVTQDIAEAMALADRVVVISSSLPVRVVLEADVESFSDSGACEDAIVSALLGAPVP
jgi:ABC-type nitrate/sulfonate/bicarbonate transport system ATPase subunit